MRASVPLLVFYLCALITVAGIFLMLSLTKAYRAKVGEQTYRFVYRTCVLALIAGPLGALWAAYASRYAR